jgi:hypothetical protein
MLLVWLCLRLALSLSLCVSFSLQARACLSFIHAFIPRSVCWVLLVGCFVVLLCKLYRCVAVVGWSDGRMDRWMNE